MSFRLTQSLLWACLAIVVLLLAWRFEKYFALVYYRMQPPPPAAAPSNSKSETPTFAIAFEGEVSGTNLFHSPNGHPWHYIDRHRLQISFGADAPTLDLESFSTLIDYRGGRLDFADFYPTLPTVSYGTAVSSTEQLFAKYGIHDRVVWNEYEKRLDARADGSETYVPTVEFAAAFLTAYMNCGWDDDAPARVQAAHVQCAPHLVLTAKPRRPSASVQAP